MIIKELIITPDGQTLVDKEMPDKTIEDVREDKLNSLNGMCSGAIYAGLDINGKHYYFTERFQSDIKGLLILMQQGFIGPFLIKETDGKRYPYTADQIKIIANVMYEWIQVNLSYNDLLPMWINREADEAVLNGIHYGSALPSDLTQELATKLASVGVDVTKYAAMFG